MAAEVEEAAAEASEAAAVAVAAELDCITLPVARVDFLEFMQVIAVTTVAPEPTTVVAVAVVVHMPSTDQELRVAHGARQVGLEQPATKALAALADLLAPQSAVTNTLLGQQLELDMEQLNNGLFL